MWGGAVARRTDEPRGARKHGHVAKDLGATGGSKPKRRRQRVLGLRTTLPGWTLISLLQMAPSFRVTYHEATPQYLPPPFSEPPPYCKTGWGRAGLSWENRVGSKSGDQCTWMMSKVAGAGFSPAMGTQLSPSNQGQVRRRERRKEPEP